jgi:hypothetical protein
VTIFWVIILSIVSLGASEQPSDNPYLKPLKPQSYSMQAIEAPRDRTRILGFDGGQGGQPDIAVEIQIPFHPRGGRIAHYQSGGQHYRYGISGEKT